MNSSDERRKSKMRTVPSSEQVASLASVGEKLKRGEGGREGGEGGREGGRERHHKGGGVSHDARVLARRVLAFLTGTQYYCNQTFDTALALRTFC